MGSCWGHHEGMCITAPGMMMLLLLPGSPLCHDAVHHGHQKAALRDGIEAYGRGVHKLQHCFEVGAEDDMKDYVMHVQLG